MSRPQHSLAHPEVPPGSYCYSAGGCCPHMSSREVAGVELTWCKLLKMGSIPNGTPEAGWAALEAHYGTSPWTDPSTGVVHQVIKDHPDTALSLLWDACKECGINDCDFQVLPKGYPNVLFEFKVLGWRREFPVTLRVASADRPTARFRSLLRQLRRLRGLLAKVSGGAALQLESVENKGLGCALGDEAQEMRLAGLLARRRNGAR